MRVKTAQENGGTLVIALRTVEALSLSVSVGGGFPSLYPMNKRVDTYTYESTLVSTGTLMISVDSLTTWKYILESDAAAASITQ
jgi:hypothetical protein